MPKNTYSVSVMHKGRESDYRDFWDHELNVNPNGEELHPGLVGFTQIIEAQNLDEAIALVQKMHPDLGIAKDHSSKVGS